MGKIWISADYSQAEARVVAFYGPVPALRGWFQSGQDVHLNVAKLIAKTMQQNKLPSHRGLFISKHWEDYTLEDVEREKGKTTVYGNNYGLGKAKFALTLGVPPKFAAVIQEIYFHLFPEIITGYQRRIDEQLNKDRTITTPFGRRRTFYSALGPDTSRAAYSYYAQSTIGDLITRTWCELCEYFDNPRGEPLSTEVTRAPLHTPQYIRSCGFDVRLQVHDQILTSVDDDTDTLIYAINKIREVAQRPFMIHNEEVFIPMDFKVGKSWGELEKWPFQT